MFRNSRDKHTWALESHVLKVWNSKACGFIQAMSELWLCLYFKLCFGLIADSIHRLCSSRCARDASSATRISLSPHTEYSVHTIEIVAIKAPVGDTKAAIVRVAFDTASSGAAWLELCLFDRSFHIWQLYICAVSFSLCQHWTDVTGAMLNIHLQFP